MADGRKYYVLCRDNCKFESMTKEQILTAITQATSGGTIGDIDTGFVTTIKTITGQPLRFFVGTQAMYDGLTDEEKTDLFAIITNDAEKEAIQATLTELLAGQADNLTKINELYDRTETNESDISSLETKYTSLNSTVTSIKNGYCKPISTSYPVGTIVVAALSRAYKPLESSFSLYYSSTKGEFYDNTYNSATKISGTWKACSRLFTTQEISGEDYDLYLVQRTS